MLLVANPARGHVGGHLVSATEELGLPCDILDSSTAVGTGLAQRLHWRLRDRRPLRQRQFCDTVLQKADEVNPSIILATGMCPLDAVTLRKLRNQGAICGNYLTDDPFNPCHRSDWFTHSLAEYNLLFTPRYANISDLRARTTAEVRYVPFAYNPRVHHPAEVADPRFAGRVLFVGGADADRVPIMRQALAAGLPLAVIGGYWERHRDLKRIHFGQATQEELNRATLGADVSLILVRRANRDGHVMRSFEAAASGGCLLVEETAEHHSMFGDEGECVRYFDTVDRLVDQAQRLLEDPEERRRLREAVLARVAQDGGCTYANRLAVILEYFRRESPSGSNSSMMHSHGG